MDFGQVQVMGFPSDLVSFLTKLPSKRHQKIHVTFFSGFFFFFTSIVIVFQLIVRSSRYDSPFNHLLLLKIQIFESSEESNDVDVDIDCLYFI